MKPDTLGDYQQRILRVLVHIQNNLDAELSLDALARVANFSPFHFHRIFRGIVGESLKEHIRRLRLERAAHRLRFTGHSVTDIALDAGYETHEAFTRAFAVMFDEPPVEFRKRHRVVAYGPSPSGVHFAADGQIQSFRSAVSGGRPLEVRVEELNPIRVAFVRHVGPYDEVGRAWDKLMSWAGSQGLFRGIPNFFGIVHDDPEVTPAGKIRYDAAFAVSGSVTAQGEVAIQEVDAARYAVATHHGPYAMMGDTYARICGEWLPSSGCEADSRPSLEFYRNSPKSTQPEHLITDLYVPLVT